MWSKLVVSLLGWTVAAFGQGGDLGPTRPGTAYDGFMHRGFYFDSETGRCFGRDGREGRSSGWVGECGYLRNHGLEGTNFSHYTLVGADLDGARLNGNRSLEDVLLARTSLRGVQARDTVWEDGEWRGGDAGRADFQGATVIRGRWIDVSAVQMRLSGGRWLNFHGERINFMSSHWEAVGRPGDAGFRPAFQFQGALTCLGCNFKAAYLMGVRADGADLRGSSLERAQLDGSTWRNANLSGVNFFAVRVGPRASFARSLLDEADWSLAQVGGADFTGVHAVGTNFHGTIWTGDSSFIGADLSQSRWDQAEVGSVEFANAVLAGADFSEARFERTSFLNADLRGANFRGAHITDVDFTGAQTEGADFTNATWVGTAPINGGNE